MRPTDNIKNEIKNLSFKASDELKQKMLADVLNAQNTKQHSAKTQSVWRIIMKSRTTRLTTAAAVLALIMVGMYNFTGSIDGASVAFANAMEHFATAQTARFDLTIEFGDQEPQTSSFLYDANGYIRQNMANGTVNFVDYNRNKVLSLVPDSNTVVIREVSKPDFHTALYDIFARLQDLIQQAIDLGHGPVESLGTKTIDGQAVYGYRVETTGQSPGLFWQGKGTLTVWADAQTDFPLILKWHNTMTNIIVTVSNIYLNEIFGPDELSITIPQGYVIRDETLLPVEAVEPEDDIQESEPEQPLLNETPGPNVADLIEGLEEDEQTLIKFFHSWTFLAKGKFPSSLTVDAIKDIDTDAKISFKQGFWSTKFSAEMPNLFGDWKPDIDPNDYTQEEIQQAKDRHGPYYQELHKKLQEHMQTYKPHFTNIAGGFGAINSYSARSDWHYNGQDATLGDADTAIFWYKPKKSKTYRVIFGDLTIEDITDDQLAELESQLPLPPE